MSDAWLDRMTGPGNANGGCVQVVFTPEMMRPFRQWLALRGLVLFPVPNGRNPAGEPVFSSEDDLPVFGIGMQEET